MAEMIEITLEEAKNKVPYDFKNHSQTSKSFRLGPQYFTKERKKDGWDTINYFTD